jgi:ribosomal protein S18 acetylase RimI-like enzyme
MTTTSELRFERATDCDAVVIADLAREHVEQGLRPAWTAPRVRRAMRERECIVLVARAAPAGRWPTRESFAGFAIMQFGDASAHLNLLAVSPPFRRRGVAGQLLEWLERSAVTAGVFDVTLEVRATNVPAQRLYVSRQYQPVRRIPKYYQGVEDAIRMRRDLRASASADGPARSV